MAGPVRSSRTCWVTVDTLPAVSVTLTAMVYRPSAPTASVADAAYACGEVYVDPELLDRAIVFSPEVASLKASDSDSNGLVVATTPLIVVPATVKVPFGATVSLIRFKVTVFGLPSPSVSVTVSVTGPSLKVEAFTGRFHHALPLITVLPLSVWTPSVIVKLTDDHFSPLIEGSYDETLAALM